MIGFALGNGKSRLKVDNNKLKTLGKIYACNRIYEEFNPDILISTDPPISKEIQDSGYPKNNIHYTRQPFEGTGSLQIDEKCRGWSSGPVAVRYACKENQTVYLLGFDLSGPEKSQINNIYAGTEHYKPVDAPLTYYGNWSGQIVRTWEEFPNVNFIRVIEDYCHTPKEWQRYEKYSEMPMNSFIEWLNKQ